MRTAVDHVRYDGVGARAACAREKARFSAINERQGRGLRLLKINSIQNDRAVLCSYIAITESTCNA